MSGVKRSPTGNSASINLTSYHLFWQMVFIYPFTNIINLNENQYPFGPIFNKITDLQVVCTLQQS